MRPLNDTILATPVSAMSAGVTSWIEPPYDYMQPDRLAFARITGVGKGTLWGPGKECPAAVGDIVAFEQRQVKQDWKDESEDEWIERIVVPFSALQAKIVDGEWHALGRHVIVVPAPEEVAAIMRPRDKLHLPFGNECVQNATGVTNMSFGRVESVGDGAEVKGGLQRPDCAPGDLIGFFDVIVSSYRGRDVSRKIVPWSEAVIGLS